VRTAETPSADVSRARNLKFLRAAARVASGFSRRGHGCAEIRHTHSCVKVPKDSRGRVPIVYRRFLIAVIVQVPHSFAHLTASDMNAAFPSVLSRDAKPAPGVIFAPRPNGALCEVEIASRSFPFCSPCRDRSINSRRPQDCNPSRLRSKETSLHRKDTEEVGVRRAKVGEGKPEQQEEQLLLPARWDRAAYRCDLLTTSIAHQRSWQRAGLHGAGNCPKF